MTENPISQADVELLLQSVGMKPRTSRIGAAITLCEAPLPPKNGIRFADFGAVGDQALANDTWGYSYGGFQIRSLRADAGTGTWRDAEKLDQPRFNCRAAQAIRKAAGGWDPWSTYTSGMYKAYLQDLYPPPDGCVVVLYGDTLTTIADNTGGFSWQELARVNGIHPPYMIFIGQTLRLPT